MRKVITYGTYDLLHRGHVRLLERAKALGDYLVVGVTADLAGRFSAVDLVRVAAAVVGGKGGGGRPDMAQAGGPDGDKADAAIEAVATALAG